MTRVGLSLWVLSLCATLLATVVVAAPVGPAPDLSRLDLSSDPASPQSVVDNSDIWRPDPTLWPNPNPVPYPTWFPNTRPPNPNPNRIDVYSSDRGWNAAGIFLVAAFIVLKIFGFWRRRRLRRHSLMSWTAVLLSEYLVAKSTFVHITNYVLRITALSCWNCCTCLNAFYIAETAIISINKLHYIIYLFVHYEIIHECVLWSPKHQVINFSNLKSNTENSAVSLRVYKTSNRELKKQLQNWLTAYACIVCTPVCTI